MIMQLYFYLTGFLILVVIILLIYIVQKLGFYEKSLKAFEDSRREIVTNLASGREEMNNTLFKMLTAQNQATTNLDARLLDILNKIDQNLSSGRKAMVEISELTSRQLSTFGNQTSESLKNFQASLETNIKSLNDLQREKFAAMDIKQSELIKGTEQKLEIIRNTVEEKLEKTLNERLGQSFETVGKQLIEVQKGLGEMQTIAQDVGGLKKVLSNVKLRGGIGEVQLAMLLEQILAPNQYKANVKISPSRNEIVEFAILLPGRAEDENTIVHLPVDAKFPKDVYENMLNAYETAIVEDIETASKVLESTIRKMAKDIRDKYIDPPYTTDFAIMFLPFESIYAEVIRRTALVDQIRDEYKVSIAGPTTLMAILNSLQMGFRTLSLQKRSSEVWQVLSSVKTEFRKFGDLLGKAQKNIQTGLSQLDEVAGKRSRAITSKLKAVEDNSTEENLIIDEEE